LLLDTHLLLWWLGNTADLSREAVSLIGDPGNVVFVSVATMWEIAIKQALGKLDIPDAFPDAIAASSFEVLAVQSTHAWATRTLPPIHRDPFDRMLVAQAQVEGLLLLTSDVEVAKYGLTTRFVGRHAE
jgi:PIN domain nuclease of toxin-antitoxin system